MGEEVALVNPAVQRRQVIHLLTSVPSYRMFLYADPIWTMARNTRRTQNQSACQSPVPELKPTFITSSSRRPLRLSIKARSTIYRKSERRGKCLTAWHATARCEAEFAMSLSAAIQCYQFDAIVCVPTKRPWLQNPYRQAILRINPDAIDYTSRISIIDLNFIGTTLDERVSNLKLEIEAVPTDLRLLVIDDVLTAGLSAAAVMHRFRLSGAGGDSFRLAFPLWIQVGLGSPMKRLLNLVK